MDANALFLVVTLEQRKANDNPPLRDIAKVHPEAKPQAGKIIVAIATCAIPLERKAPPWSIKTKARHLSVNGLRPGVDAPEVNGTSYSALNE